MLTRLKGARSHLCETNVEMQGGIPVLSVLGMGRNSPAELVHFFSLPSLSPPHPFTNKTCQPVHQLCDGRQMFQQNTCQISIDIG